MNKIAFREHSGDWIYYLSWFTYAEVAKLVKKVDCELHKSKSLNDMIQRSLTDNVDKIASYIINQPEHFFNALVLAVYDGDPQWREVVFDYGDDEIFNLGILELSGNEKIFPVDGQHRVEGIKKVLEQSENSKFSSETIPVILIGHKNTPDGMQRTRRLFSTLNRYAKPVTLNDIIALDEDDIIAISTRHLIETNPLFNEERLKNHKQKAISDKDRKAFTNIITLYECNTQILKYFIENKTIEVNGKPIKGKRKIEEYCRIRPTEDEICSFINFIDDFWNSFSSEVDAIKEYLSIDINHDPAAKFRHQNGGNLLFRPIGQRPFVMCAIELYREIHNMKSVMKIMNKLNFALDSELWKFIAWNPINNKMIASSNASLIELILKYLTGIKLSESNKSKLSSEYLSMKKDENSTKEEVLQELQRYVVV